MANRAFDECEDAPPNPAATIESLGSLGYSTESAIADLVDNSISTGATRVAVTMHWDGEDSWCAIVDNGRGMTEDRLREAMVIGSHDPLLPRGKSDLGRFGFGLKTASFSQCRELTVASRNRKGCEPAIRCWDLDFVREQGRWLLLKSPGPEARKVLASLFDPSRGTAVLWRRLTGDLVEEDADRDDERSHQLFLTRLSSVVRHLGMTFGRFLMNQPRLLAIFVNGVRISGWDPFLPDHPATQRLPDTPLRFRGECVLVSPFVLPHRTKLTEAEYEAGGGPQGWNAQQGFYVYRSNRLIQAGDWFDRRQAKDDQHNLARIAIDIPSELDRAWSLDVKKASVRPPGALVADLRRIADETRRRALRVYRHRGTVVHGPSETDSVEPVWNQIRRRGTYAFRVNRKHPLIAEMLVAAGPERKLIAEVLRIVEETVPIPLLPGAKGEDVSHAFDDEPDASLIALAERLYERFLTRGLTRRAAREQLSRTEPFNLYPDLIRRICDRDE